MWMVGPVAFALGFASAWLIYRPSALDNVLSVLYKPSSQFATSAVTVTQLHNNRVAEAISVNCRAMRNAVAALELAQDGASISAKAKFDNMVRTGQCQE